MQPQRPQPKQQVQRRRCLAAMLDLLVGHTSMKVPRKHKANRCIAALDLHMIGAGEQQKVATLSHRFLARVTSL